MPNLLNRGNCKAKFDYKIFEVDYETKYYVWLKQ